MALITHTTRNQLRKKKQSKVNSGVSVCGALLQPMQLNFERNMEVLHSFQRVLYSSRIKIFVQIKIRRNLPFVSQSRPGQV